MGQYFSRTNGHSSPVFRFRSEAQSVPTDGHQGIHGSQSTAPRQADELQSWAAGEGPSRSDGSTRSRAYLFVSEPPVNRAQLLADVRQGHPDAGRLLCRLAINPANPDSAWAEQTLYDQAFSGRDIRSATGQMLRFELLNLYQCYRASNSLPGAGHLAAFERPSGILVLLGFEALERGFFSVAAGIGRTLQPLLGQSIDTHAGPCPLANDRMLSAAEIACVFDRLQEKDTWGAGWTFRLHPPMLALPGTEADLTIATVNGLRAAGRSQAAKRQGHLPHTPPSRLNPLRDPSLTCLELSAVQTPTASGQTDWALVAQVSGARPDASSSLSVFTVHADSQRPWWQGVANRLGMRPPVVIGMPGSLQPALHHAGGVVVCHAAVSVLCAWAERRRRPEEAMQGVAKQFESFTLGAWAGFNLRAREEILLAMAAPQWRW